MPDGKPTTSPGLVSSEALAGKFGLLAIPSDQGGTNYATSGAKDVTVLRAGQELGPGRRGVVTEGHRSGGDHLHGHRLRVHVGQPPPSRPAAVVDVAVGAAPDQDAGAGFG